MVSNTNHHQADTRTQAGQQLLAIGAVGLRYGLVVVIGWIGLMKFTAYEANGIQPLVAHSPFMSWLYGFLSIRGFANALGTAEVSIAVLIGLRRWSAKASAIGSAAAVVMFLTTLSFLFSTPGWEPSLGGFPALSGAVGQFLLKDVVLLGAALWCFGEAWTAGRCPNQVMMSKTLYKDSYAAIPLRLIVGYGFMEHGFAKLARGSDAFAGILHAMEIPAPHLMAQATIWIEVLGGLAVLLGAFIALASIPMAAVLLVAMFTVHLPYGFSSIKLKAVAATGAQFGPPGYETDLLYLACLAALILCGPGPFSMDRIIQNRKREQAR